MRRSQDRSTSTDRNPKSSTYPPSRIADMQADRHLPPPSFQNQPSWSPSDVTPPTQRSYGAKAFADGRQSGAAQYGMHVDNSYGRRGGTFYSTPPQFDPVNSIGVGYPESSQRTHLNETSYRQGYAVPDRHITHRGHQPARSERANDRIVENRTMGGTRPTAYCASPGTRASGASPIPDTRMSSAMHQRMDVFSSSSSPTNMDGRPRSLSSLHPSNRQQVQQNTYTFQTFSNSLDPVRDRDSESLLTSCVDSNDDAETSRSPHSTSQPSSPAHPQSHWSLSSLDSSLHSVFSDRSYGVPSNNESASPRPDSGRASYTMNLTDSSQGSFSTSNEVESSSRAKKTKMHQCDICQKWFPRPSGLATHMNSHSGAKPYKCPVDSCDKSFTVRSNAKRHLRTHGIIPDVEPPDSKPQFSIGFHTPQVSHVHELSKGPQKLRWIPQSLETRTNLNWLQSSPASDSDAEDDVVEGSHPELPQVSLPPGTSLNLNNRYELRNSYPDAGNHSYQSNQWRGLPDPTVSRP